MKNEELKRASRQQGIKAAGQQGIRASGHQGSKATMQQGNKGPDDPPYFMIIRDCKRL